MAVKKSRHIIIVPNKLLGLFLDSLTSHLDGEVFLVEVSTTPLIKATKFPLKRFIHSSNLSKALQVRKAIKHLQKLVAGFDTSQIHYYVAHASHPLANYLLFNAHGSFNLIPDGAMNFVEAKGWSGTWRNFLNARIFYLLSGFLYRKPYPDIYGSGVKRWNKRFVLSEKYSLLPKADETIELKINSTFINSKLTVVLGQVIGDENFSLYVKHIEKIIIKEKSFGRHIYFRPHPSSGIPDMLQEMLIRHEVNIDDSDGIVESNKLGFSRFVGITSTPLLTMKIIDPRNEAVMYPKNLWNLDSQVYTNWISNFEKVGCEVIYL